MTARDRYADLLPIGPWMMRAIYRQSLHEQVAAGLDALVALWFDEYTDETDLPPELEPFVLAIRDWIGAEALSDRLTTTLDPTEVDA